jgi:hypothetical protein
VVHAELWAGAAVTGACGCTTGERGRVRNRWDRRRGLGRRAEGNPRRACVLWGAAHVLVTRSPAKLRAAPLPMRDILIRYLGANR